jgi:hypothetical protein
MKLIPQYSLRRLLAIMTISAVAFSIVALGLRGYGWAAGVAVALLAVAVLGAVYAAVFALIWLVAEFFALAQPSAGSRSRPRPPVLLILAAAALASGPDAEAIADPTGSLQTSAGAGLNMSVDTRWLDGPGYRPVRIDVTPTAAVIADRTLSVEILVYRSWRDQAGYDLRVAGRIEIPAGSGPSSGPFTLTLAVPRMEGSDLFAVNVFEDGSLLRGLSLPAGRRTGYYGGASGEMLPNVLFVGSDIPSTVEMAATLPVAENWQGPPAPLQSPAGPLVLELFTAMSLPAAGLPQRWLDYTNLDVVCLSLDELAALAEKRPAAFRAVTDWTAAGGNLWVYEVGGQFARLDELEKRLGLPPGQGDRSSKPTARGWREPDPALFGKPLDVGPQRGQPIFSRPMAPAAPFVEELSEPGEPMPPPVSPPKEPHFVLRDYQAGMIVAFADDPFPGTKANWAWVLAATGPERWQWGQRHGLSMIQPNRDFWNFLIPGVGLVPVVEFGVLITVFVLVIGPLNYVLLRRWKRLHLLVVTIPAGAAAVTLTLFLYALLADGLGTRVRVRSVTHIDQRAGRAVCWARSSYYAGLAPSGGLRFPQETAVYPLEAATTESRNNSARGQELIWGDEQWLATGWLPARTPTQYVTVRARATDRGLTVAKAPKDAQRIEVANRLGARAVLLFLRTADGTCYRAQDLADGASGAAERVEPTEAVRQLAADYRIHLPQFPPAMEAGNLDYGIGSRGRYRWSRSYFGRPTLPVTQESGRLERLLAASAGMSPGAGGGAFLPPSTYAAIVDRSPEVALGTPAAREEGGYHVILGEYD